MPCQPFASAASLSREPSTRFSAALEVVLKSREQSSGTVSESHQAIEMLPVKSSKKILKARIAGKGAKGDFTGLLRTSAVLIIKNEDHYL